MVPSFNIAGPCIPGEHYMLPPERRLGRVLRLIDQRKYFTLHAGRQTGKTTSARWMVQHFNAGERLRAVLMDVQTAREQPDPAKAFRTVLGAFEAGMRRHLPDLPRPSADAVEQLLTDPTRAILRYLQAISAACALPLLVLIDEADGLVGPAMVSFLTQLREGYLFRGETPFPTSVGLLGQRQVRDFILAEEERQAVLWLGTSSPFNITAEATTLVPFTDAEIGELIHQHTESTGQVFTPAAVARIVALSCGHPWLVNALADQIVTWDVEDRSTPITAEHVEAAKETIIIERRSHIDSLVARLREPRVRRVLDPMLAGDQFPVDLLNDDLNYSIGLGLVTTRCGFAEIANPIYQEVIPRALTWVRQMSIPNDATWYLRPDGGLDMPRLMAAWQEFWREDGHLAAAGFAYRESGPHLMLMAFLQRGVNGGGQIAREYGLGRGALDLMITWERERFAVEVKLRRDTRTEEKGRVQLARYLEQAGLDEGWLVLFDLRSAAPWAERLFLREETTGGKRIHVVGC